MWQVYYTEAPEKAISMVILLPGCSAWGPHWNRSLLCCGSCSEVSCSPHLVKNLGRCEPNPLRAISFSAYIPRFVLVCILVMRYRWKTSSCCCSSEEQRALRRGLSLPSATAAGGDSATEAVKNSVFFCASLGEQFLSSNSVILCRRDQLYFKTIQLYSWW